MWAKKFNADTALPAVLISLLLVLVCAVFAFPYFIKAPAAVTDLSKLQWKAEYQIVKSETKESFSIKVPQDVTAQKDPSFRGNITYFTKFGTPNECLSDLDPCTLFVSEVGDAALVFVNGVEIGSHGAFPPNGRYAKNIPVSVNIPQVVLRRDGENSLTIQVHSFKHVQAGVRKGPIGIFHASDAHILNIAQIAQTIISPLISAIILFVFAFGANAVMLFGSKRHDSIKQFTYFCSATALFLFSFSEIPREILPIAFAGYLHYFLRIFSDFMFFNLVASLFFRGSRGVGLVRYLYVLTLVLFVAVYFANSSSSEFSLSGFDGAYVITRVALPLILLPHVLGILGARRIESKTLRYLLTVLFVFTLICQVNDSLVFHAYVKGQYLVKFYPTLVAFCLGAYIFDARFSEWVTERSNTVAKIELSRQVAHDIRSPLAALQGLTTDLSIADPEKRRILRNALDRIGDIASGLLNYDRLQGVSKQQGRRVVGLHSILEDLVSEFRNSRIYKSKRLSLVLSVEDFGFRAFAFVDVQNLKRALANFVGNAIDAAPHFGRVEVVISLSGDTKHSQITITDDGLGFTEEALAKMGRVQFTSKSNGNGIGVLAATGFLAEMNGSVQFLNQPDGGARVEIVLPAVSPPDHLLTALSMPASAKVCVVDDDSSLLDTWKNKLGGLITRPKLVQRLDELDGVPLDQFSYFFIDLDLAAQGFDGLGYIEANGLESRSVLVTSFSEDLNVIDRAKQLGVKILPKSLLPFINVEIFDFTEKLVVLIDDDPLVRTFWSLRAKEANVRLVAFESGEAALNASIDLRTTAAFFVDAQLRGESGEEIVNELYERGYKNLHLATGLGSIKLKYPYTVTGVWGKDAPF